MCGIFGFSLNRSLNKDDLVIGRRALKMLEHRGPDDEGEWFNVSLGLFLGHRRLTVIDPSCLSKQPIKIEESILSYNGEIYNYIELRNELKKTKCNFNSEGDAEVLLQCWRHWGQSALNKFDGMFAFSLYDGELLHLVTDPFGEKPLYILERSEGVYFSSEAQVLIELFDLEFSPTENELAGFLSLGFSLDGVCGYRGLKLLPSSTHLKILKGKIKTINKYWSPPIADIRKGKVQPLTESQIDAIHEDIHESLKLRLRSDVPMWLFLSGGVDSSLVAAMVSKDFDIKIQALTIAYSDGVDESQDAAELAQFLGLPHVIIDSADNTSWKRAPEQLKKLYGVPNDNMTAVSVEQMSLLARQYMTVALSGTGGDELFYGYNKYHFLYKHRVSYYLLPPLVKALEPLDFLLNHIPRWRNSKKLLNGTSDWQFLSLKNNGLGELLKTISNNGDWAEGLLPSKEIPMAFRARDFDLNTMLQNSYIPAIERGSMRASLEVRTPFLSRKLVETIGSMDQRSFLAFGQKEVLKRVLARYLPNNLMNRPKQGFVFPFNRFLSQKHLTTPDVPMLSNTIIDKIWSNRLNRDYQVLAMRLAVLSAFSSNVIK